MAYKEFHFQSEARAGLLRGAKTLTRRYRARRRTRTAAAMDAVEAEEAKHLGGVTPFRWRVRSLGLVVVSDATFRS
jgi:hypothetical protein